MADPLETQAAYVVVLAPASVGRQHGDTPKAILRPGRHVSYRGLDRDPWWNLDDLYYAGLLDAELTDLRRSIGRAGLEGFSPGVCGSLDAARRVQGLSATHALQDEIIRIAGASDAIDAQANFFGYDCYVDGFGSLLRLGIFSATDAFADYESQLNADGLFSTLDDLRHYVAAYCERCEQANLEVIEARRISAACFFRIWGL